MSKATKLIQRYEKELNSPGPLSKKIKGIFGKKVDDYETRRRLQKSVYTRKKNLKNRLMSKKAETAANRMMEKKAFIGAGVNVGYFDDDKKWSASVGFPYLVGVHRNIGDSKETIRPSIGLGLTGPMLGLNF